MEEEHFVKLVNTALKAGGIHEGGSHVEKERAVGVLKELEAYEVNTSLLEKTKGGRLVRQLCKSAIPEIKAAAKDVIKAWKAHIIAEDEKLFKEKFERELKEAEKLLCKEGNQSVPSGPLTTAQSITSGSKNRTELSSSGKLLKSCVMFLCLVQICHRQRPLGRRMAPHLQVLPN